MSITKNVKEKLAEAIGEQVVVTKAIVTKSAEIVGAELTVEHREKMGEHGINVMISATEALLEDALMDFDRAFERCDKAIGVVQAKLSSLVKGHKKGARRAVQAVRKQAVKMVAGLARLRGALDLEVPEVAKDAEISIDFNEPEPNSDDNLIKAGYFQFAFRLMESDTYTKSYSSIGGKLRLPAAISQAWKAVQSVRAERGELESGAKEVRRRLQKIGAYERRLRGQLSADILTQSEHGREIIAGLQKIKSIALPKPAKKYLSGPKK